MTSTEVFHLVDMISNIPSRSEKIDLLNELLVEKEFRDIVILTYDPTIRFYVLDLPPVSGGLKHFDAYTYKLLDMLSKRETTGDAARIALINELQQLDMESGELLRRILKKDLRFGASVKTINKAMKGLIKELPYMRCSLLKDVKIETFDWEEGVFSQSKENGMFGALVFSNGVMAYTRKNNPLPLPEKFIKSVEQRLIPDTRYDGEFLIYVDGEPLPRAIGNGRLESMLQGGELEPYEDLKYIVWDTVPVKRVSVAPYRSRFKRLESLAKDSQYLEVVETRIVHSFEEAERHFEEITDKGGEGTIFKNPNSIWKDGTSREQVKLKSEKTIDLIVIGLKPGKGKFEGQVGSLICTTNDGALLVSVSGMSDDLRSKIDVHWINRIVEVKYNELVRNTLTKEYSLYLPRLVEARFDKTRADDIGRAM